MTGLVTATPCRRCSTVILLLPRMTSRFACLFQYSMLAQAAASGPLGVNQKLVQIGGVIVVGGSVQKGSATPAAML